MVSLLIHPLAFVLMVLRHNHKMPQPQLLLPWLNNNSNSSVLMVLFLILPLVCALMALNHKVLI
jgi:hypothetical protein